MKKLLSLLMVATLIIGMTFGASAATVSSSKIRKIDEAGFQETLEKNASAGKVTLDGTAVRTIDELADLEVVPGSEIRIQLTPDMFLDSADKPSGSSSDTLPLSALSSGRISVRTSTTGTGNPVTVTLDGDRTKTYIKIAFSKSPAYNGKKFSNSIFFTVNGSRRTATRIPVKGIIQAEEIEVDAYDDYVDISKGQTVKAVETVRNIEINLGEGLIIKRNLFRNKKYSGTATTELLDKDEPLFSKYQNLEYIYRLETVGLKVEGNTVYFDLDDQYYVYNTNGAYLGTSDKLLPYWTKYYLTTSKYASIAVIK